MGYAPAEILKYAEFALQTATDLHRIEVLNTMMKIVRSTYEGSKNT
jgi:hypothetical protein